MINIFDNILINKNLTKKNIDTNINILKIIKIIKTSFEIIFLIYVYYNTLNYIICQEKLYDKIRQIATDANIPVISAHKAANRTNLIFFIPTELV